MCEACPPENSSGISAETRAKLRDAFGEPKPVQYPSIHWPHGSKPPVTREEIERRWDKAFGKPSVWGRAMSSWSRVSGR